MQKSRFVIRIDDLIVCLFAFEGFLSLQPYFTWSDYSLLFGMGQYLIRATELLIFISYIIANNTILERNRDRPRFLSMLLILFECTIIFSLINELTAINIYARLSQFATLALFLNLKKEYQARIFEKFYIIFAVSVIPSLIILLLHYIHIDLPFEYMRMSTNASTGTTVFYKHYIGAIFKGSSYLANITEWRISGMITEPGAVGTVAALLLVGGGIILKKGHRKEKICFISGVLSFSLAFYLMLIVGWVISSAKKNKLKILLSILAVIVLYNAFLTIDFHNEQLSRLQYRLQITDGALNGDNREHKSYKIEFDNFVASGGTDLLFGKGEGATAKNINMYSSYTYKSLIYEYGIIGFIFIIVWIVGTSYYMTQRRLFKDFSFLALLSVFLISMYQRPNVFEMAFFIVLFGGFSFIDYEGIKQESSIELPVYFNQR